MLSLTCYDSMQIIGGSEVQKTTKVPREGAGDAYDLTMVCSPKSIYRPMSRGIIPGKFNPLSHGLGNYHFMHIVHDPSKIIMTTK